MGSDAHDMGHVTEAEGPTATPCLWAQELELGPESADTVLAQALSSALSLLDLQKVASPAQVLLVWLLK